MITKEQTLTANEFHHGKCVKRIGPRGGVTLLVNRWRRNGRTQIWKTRSEWVVPVKHGLRDYAYVTERDADMWHTAEDCRPVEERS
ncbi:hypothetical protein LCGC14_2015940 [marine sediment metagenome]|uniref:Uncharacterized protein n=1 Tax=marine sediment metagenome TaxID=412755 RepID=A0A0F9EZ53_9ZZZZ